jgi:hypothetical protein
VNDTNVEARGSVGVAVEVIKATKKQETQPWLSVKVEQGTRRAVKWNYMIQLIANTHRTEDIVWMTPYESDRLLHKESKKENRHGTQPQLPLVKK